MPNKHVTLAEKIELLFELVKRPDGQRVTYEYIERATGIKASTVSRLRHGHNLDPLFTNILGIAEAFGVPVGYFSTDMTVDEARQYLAARENTKFLDELQLHQRQVKHLNKNRKLAELALRASYLDDEGIAALADMADYVLRRMGVTIPDEELEKMSDTLTA